MERKIIGEVAFALNTHYTLLANTMPQSPIEASINDKPWQLPLRKQAQSRAKVSKDSPATPESLEMECARLRIQLMHSHQFQDVIQRKSSELSAVMSRLFEQHRALEEVVKTKDIEIDSLRSKIAILEKGLSSSATCTRCEALQCRLQNLEGALLHISDVIAASRHDDLAGR